MRNKSVTRYFDVSPCFSELSSNWIWAGCVSPGWSAGHTTGRNLQTANTPLTRARTRRLQLIQDRVAGAADSEETPRLPSPQTPPPAPLGGAQGVPRPAERHSPSSVSWASFQWDVPGTPPEEGVQEASANHGSPDVLSANHSTSVNLLTNHRHSNKSYLIDIPQPITASLPSNREASGSAAGPPEHRKYKVVQWELDPPEDPLSCSITTCST
ncbi:hypothetical protein CHARACLAT_008268 [Characodon lateralis]|uniref:Uncharacterized protein n=1 Tax=Characodon lateralis TaxID=208331 RepID=A0ABU7DT13_9TELE|nr:hypothetical protein [Characodon lateralis]